MPLFRLENTGSSAVADIQDSTFLRDALSRFVCNTLDEALASAPSGFDVVVVGSGMYGAYYAAKLFEFTKHVPGVKPRILVLQEGPMVIYEHFQNLPQGLGAIFGVPLAPLLPEGQFRIITPDGAPETNRVNAGRFSPHHRCVGGKSLFWGGWAPTLRPADLLQWPAPVAEFLNGADGYDGVTKEIGARDEPADGRDFIYGDLYECLLQHGKTLVPIQIDAEGYSIERVLPPPIAVSVRSEFSGLFSPDKFSSLPLLIDAIREDIDAAGGSDEKRRLFLVPNVHVAKLDTSEGFVRSIQVAVRDPVGFGGSVHGRKIDLPEYGSVVLAGNTINSTRLARNSFPRPAELTSERMGANLMVHVRGNYLWRVRRSVFEEHDSDLVSKKSLQQAALQIEGTITTSKGRKARYHFQFYAAPISEGGSAEPFLYQMVPDREDLIELEQALDDAQWITVGIRTCGEAFGDQNAPVAPGGERSGTTSWMDTSQFSSDEFGQPHGFVQLVNDSEVDEVRFKQRSAAFRFMAALVGVPIEETGKQEKDVDLNDPDVKMFLLNGQDSISATEDGLGTTYHECGTLWMGEDPDTSVTDVNARFHHVANAYVVDQSLFPTGGSANPVPTGLTLARLAARAMTNRYAPEKPFDDRDAGFISLFDGTLNAWASEGMGNFRVVHAGGKPILEAGLAGVDSALGLLRFTGQTFSNFVLRLEWKAFSSRANAGVFLRTPPVGGGGLDAAFYAQCTEIQIDDSGKNFDPARQPNVVYGGFRERTGAIYGVAPSTQGRSKAFRPRFTADGEWNVFEIRAEGSSVTVQHNGAVVSSASVAPNLPRAGHIALQCHTDIVQFRNIRVRPL